MWVDFGVEISVITCATNLLFKPCEGTAQSNLPLTASIAFLNSSSTSFLRVVILMIGLCVGMKSAKAQLLHAIYTKGIVVQNSDTIRASIYIPMSDFNIKTGPDYPRMQRIMRYTDNQGKKKKINPDDAQELVFTFEYQKIRMISVRLLGPELTGTRFLRLMEDGKMRLFIYYRGSKEPMNLGGATPSAYAMRGEASFSSNFYVIQNEGVTTIVVNQHTTLDILKSCFRGCESIVDRFNSKEFSYHEIPDMVRFYNLNCANVRE